VKRSKPPLKGADLGTQDGARIGKNKQTLERADTLPPVVAVATRDSNGRAQTPQPWSERKRLFLRVGDEVSHLRYEEWGIGVVVELMTSSVPGGTCLARVRFQDGQLRCFNNDLDNEACCYYFGVQRYWNPSHGVNAIRSKFFLRE